MPSAAREPALILIGVIGPAVALLVSFIPALTPELQTGLIAAAVAIAGILTALLVGGDRLAPAILGLAQAVVTIGLAAGLDLSPEQQAGWLTIVGILVAAFVRTQVNAPVVRAG
jgi:uncharacterized membrane protein HdeD (DUF308 family)